MAMTEELARQLADQRVMITIGFVLLMSLFIIAVIELFRR